MRDANLLVTHKTFGRRVIPQFQARLPAPPPGVAPVMQARPPVSLDPVLQVPRNPLPSDEELADWKKARKKNYRIPWRQLSLMATLCFGIASLALPEWVNDEVQWVLYALMAASLYTSFAMRRRKADG